MGALYELTEYCKEQKKRGKKVISLGYVLMQLEIHDYSERKARIGVVDSRMNKLSNEV